MEKNATDVLGVGSVGKLLWRLALPAIAAQVINLLYSIVDRMYIGRIVGIGKLALTGVGVCMPLIMLISASAALVSMGGSPRASIYLGRGDKPSAEKTLGNCAALLVIIAVVLTLALSFFSRDLLLMFGASENTIDYAADYMGVYALGTLFVQLTLGLNPFISAQGFAKTSMLTVFIGAVCNIVLDPIFIFALKMGVAGAALATVISQAVSALWILRFLTGKKTVLRLQLRDLRLSGPIIGPCIALGLSPFVMQSTESLLSACFNSSLLKYGGDLAVGAMTVLTSVKQFAIMPILGLLQGSQPIISYNYGAKNAARVKQAFKLLLISCVSFSGALWLLAQLMPEAFVRIFNDDPELVAFAARAMRVYMAVFILMGVQFACQQSFVALGKAKSPLFLALLRKIVLLIPLIYIMPALFPADKCRAVFMAEPVADILAVLTTSCLFFIQFRRILREIE